MMDHNEITDAAGEPATSDDATSVQPMALSFKTERVATLAASDGIARGVRPNKVKTAAAPGPVTGALAPKLPI